MYTYVHIFIRMYIYIPGRLTHEQHVSPHTDMCTQIHIFIQMYAIYLCMYMYLYIHTNNMCVFSCQTRLLPLDLLALDSPVLFPDSPVSDALSRRRRFFSQQLAARPRTKQSLKQEVRYDPPLISRDCPLQTPRPPPQSPRRPNFDSLYLNGWADEVGF